MKKRIEAILGLSCGIIALIVVSIMLSSRQNIAFSHVSGFYNEPFILEISTNIWGAKIYYTTDGSVPDCNDDVYISPLYLTEMVDTAGNLSERTDIALNDMYTPLDDGIMKGHVIRAVAITPWGVSSPVMNGTYFIGYDREKEFGNAPVISIMIEEWELFDYEKGIYVVGKTYDDWMNGIIEPQYAWIKPANYANRGKEWERKALMEYMPFDPVPGFSQDIGLRIKGNVSRRHKQKGFRLTARAEYGQKAMNYPLIPDNRRLDGKGEVKSYKSISLRNGGNDAYIKISDPLIQRLATGMNFTTQDSKPCVVFINGEYWGAYAITEEYSDNYIGYNLDIDNDNVVTYKVFRIEDGREEDIAFFDEMYRYIVSNDMSLEENYLVASQMLDMESYQDYCALQLYIGNPDSIFQWNNYQMWRVREPGIDQNKTYSDGKWRMMLYDTELALGIEQSVEFLEKGFIEPLISESYVDTRPEGDHNPLTMVRELWKNETFRRELVLSMCDTRNIYFEEKRARKVFDEIVQEYKPLLIKSMKRFPSEYFLGDFQGYVDYHLERILQMITQRYVHFPQILQQNLGLSQPCTIRIRNADPEKGKVLLNRNKLDLGKDFVGVYFPEYPIRLTAIPDDQQEFVGWEKNGEMISTEEDIEIPVEEGITINAVFQ